MLLWAEIGNIDLVQVNSVTINGKLALIIVIDLFVLAAEQRRRWRDKEEKRDCPTKEHGGDGNSCFLVCVQKQQSK